MVIFMYRWRIPSARHKEFEQNWKELTEEVKTTHRMISAILYRCGDCHVSIATWSSKDGWDTWKSSLADHPYRTKWREFRIDDEILIPVAHVNPPT